MPTSLLLIVVAAIISDDGECNDNYNNVGGGVTVCEREPRSFVNAFTTRCVCDAVKSSSGTDAEEENEEDGIGGLF